MHEPDGVELQKRKHRGAKQKYTKYNGDKSPISSMKFLAVLCRIRCGEDPDMTKLRKKWIHGYEIAIFRPARKLLLCSLRLRFLILLL